MSLHTSEAAQCSTCEEYSRLGELVNVELKKDGSVKLMKGTRADNRGGYIGNCPHCGERICQNDVC